MFLFFYKTIILLCAMRHHILILELGIKMAKISFAYCSMHRIIASQVAQKGPLYFFMMEIFVFYIVIITYNLLRIMRLPKVKTSNHLIAYFNHIAPWLKKIDVYILRWACL